jgi:hypothetical protein
MQYHGFASCVLCGTTSNALGNPEKFAAEQSLTLADIRRGMQRQQLSGMRQRDMRNIFAPV